MADLAAIRLRVAELLSDVPHHAIEGEYLNASPSELDAIVPPHAMVGTERIAYDDHDTLGMDIVELVVTLLVSRAEVKSGQDALDIYTGSAGPSSVKAVLETDRTLNGTVDRFHFREWDNFGPIEVAGTTYLGAQAHLVLRASP